MSAPIDAARVLDGLEVVAERCGDPTALVYERLFAQTPEMRELFVLGDAAKGHMLQEVIEIVVDYVGPRTYAPHFVRSEIVNHENLGVPPQVFASFFAVVADTFREAAGSAWTGEIDAAWRALVGELERLTEMQAA